MESRYAQPLRGVVPDLKSGNKMSKRPERDLDLERGELIIPRCEMT